MVREKFMVFECVREKKCFGGDFGFLLKLWDFIWSLCVSRFFRGEIKKMDFDLASGIYIRLLVSDGKKEDLYKKKILMKLVKKFGDIGTIKIFDEKELKRDDLEKLLGKIKISNGNYFLHL